MKTKFLKIKHNILIIQIVLRTISYLLKFKNNILIYKNAPEPDQKHQSFPSTLRDPAKNPPEGDKWRNHDLNFLRHKENLILIAERFSFIGGQLHLPFDV
jgi:hypothetical protein